MQLYWVGDRYVRTQGEAQKLGFGAVTEVPTDKDGLMGFLNDLHKRQEEDRQAALRTIESLNRDGPDTHVLDEAKPAQEESVAAQQLRQLDVEDAIQAADFTQLMVYGNNVFDRFRDLAREMENKS